MGLQRIIFNIFQLTSTEAMSSCEGRFVKIGVVFHALYFENEVGDPQFFFSDIGNSLSDCSQSMKKICVEEVFRANVLKACLVFACFQS